MASFTDDVPVFTPYIAQQPVEAMAQVGVRRQEQFEKGIETVNSYYSTLLNLPIAKQATQEYIKEKVGQLNKAVSQSISGDFSDRRLVNQIGGLASQISNDPIVENGVTSTAAVQAGIAQMNEAKKAGKSSPQNEAKFNDIVNTWLNDGKVETQFSGSYSPYVDVIGEAIKIYKEMHPGEDIERDAYSIDKNGNVFINPTLKSGISSRKLNSALNLLYQKPEIQNQLAIDGWYKYKNLTPENLSLALETTTNQNLKLIEETIKALEIKKTSDSTANTQQINDNISDLKQQAKQLETEFNENILLVQANPDAFKAKLAKDDITSNFMSAFAYETMKKSPLFDADLEAKKFELDLQKFGLDKDQFEQKKRMDAWSIEKDKLTLEKDKSKPKEGELGYSVNRLPVENTQGEMGSVTAEKDMAMSFDNYVYQRRKLAHDFANVNQNIPLPYVLDPATGDYVWNKAAYKTEGEANIAAKQIFDQLSDDFNKGTIDPVFLPQYNLASSAWDNWQTKQRVIKDVDNEFAPRLAEIKSTLGSDDYFSVFSIENRLPGWEGEAKKLASKYGANSGIVEEMIKAASVAIHAPGGKKVFDRGLANLGLNPTDYRSKAKGIDHQSLKLQLEDREQAFKKRQITTENKSATFDISTPAKKLDVERRISGLANAELALKDNPKRGEAQKIVDMIAAQDDEKGWKNTAYTAVYDQYNKEGVIQVWRGSEREEIRVTPDRFFETFPELRVDDTFDRLYGARLANNGASTAVGTSGGRKAQPYLTPNPKYVVQHHVIKDGDGYNIIYWIADKASPDTPIIDGKPYFDRPVGKGNVVRATQQDFADPNYIRQLVEQKATQNQLLKQ